MINPAPGTKAIALLSGTKLPDTSLHRHGYLDAVAFDDIIPATKDWGLVVDGLYLVIDIDSPGDMPQEFFSSLPSTYTQTTKRGQHFTYSLPVGVDMTKIKNAKLKNGDITFGDVKVKGYIVGSGSTVEGYTYSDNGLPVAPCPTSFLLLASRPKSEVSTYGEGGRSGVATGEHDEFLFKLASWARGQADLSEDAISRLLRRGPLAVLQDVDSSKPYEDTDLARIARSAGRYAPANTLEDSSLAPSTWKAYTDLDTRLPLKDWHLYNFIPQNELTLVYGNGGIGKSSFASWLVSQILDKDKKVGFAGVEEPFLRFGARASLSVADRDCMRNLLDIGNTWRFPDDESKLRDALEEFPLDVLYFDSIYSHFGNVQGHEGVRARVCLSPLASIAQEMGVTVIGTFHENKAGDIMGSVEMQNVCRVLLHAKRSKGTPFQLSVKKTNFTEPGYALQFNGNIQPATSLDNEPWLEKDEQGNTVPVKLFVIDGYLKIGDDAESDEQVYNLDEIVDSTSSKVKKLLEENPTYTVREMADMIGVKKSTIGNHAKKFR
jgi:hypothetical protein